MPDSARADEAGLTSSRIELGTPCTSWWTCICRGLPWRLGRLVVRLPHVAIHHEGEPGIRRRLQRSLEAPHRLVLPNPVLVLLARHLRRPHRSNMIATNTKPVTASLYQLMHKDMSDNSVTAVSYMHQDHTGRKAHRQADIPDLSSPQCADVADQSHSPLLEGCTCHPPAKQNLP